VPCARIGGCRPQDERAHARAIAFRPREVNALVLNTTGDFNNHSTFPRYLVASVGVAVQALEKRTAELSKKPEMSCGQYQQAHVRYED
jgi:hypothetical protein